MNEKSRTYLGRWGIIALPAVGYILLLLALEPVIGPMAALLLALPIAAITWEFGLVWGFIGGLVGITLNSLYLVFVNNFDINELLEFGIFPGAIILAAMIFVVSVLRRRMEEYFRLGMESRSREEYFSLLSDITTKILLASDLNLILDDISEDMAKLIGADHSCVVQWDEERKGAIPSSVGTAPLKPINALDSNSVVSLSLTAAAMEAGNTVTVDNVENSPYLFPDIVKDIPAHSIMSVPLISHGHKVGAAIFAFSSLHTFTPAEIKQAEHAASHIAVAILNLQQEVELTNRLHESDAFAKIAATLSETEHTGLSSVLQLILEFAKDLIHGTEQAVIHLLDDNKEYLIPEALIGYEKSVEGKKKMRLGEGIAGQAVVSGESVSIGDAHIDPRFIKLDSKSRTRSLIVVPIRGGSEALGTISVQSGRPNIFTHREQALLSRLGTQAAIAIENARLYAAAKSEIAERMKAEDALRQSIEKELRQRLIAETSTEATLALVSYSDKEKVLTEILNQVQRLVPGSSVNIALLNEKGDIDINEVVWRGFQGDGYDDFSKSPDLLKISPIEQDVIKTGKLHIVRDTHNHPRWGKVKGTEWIRSHLTMPLIWRDSPILGLFELDGAQPNMFSEETVKRLTPLINAVTVALQSAQLLERTQLALRETNALYRINQGLVALNPDELLEDVVDLFQNNLEYYHVQVYIVEGNTGDFVLRASSGKVGRQLMESNHHIKAGSGIVGHVLETTQPFYTNNVDDIVFFNREPLLPDTKSEMAVPVKINNKIVGVINVLQAPPKRFTNRDLQLATAVADQLSVALQKANFYNDLQTALQHEKDVRNQLIQSERLAIMGRLLATVSHELNNPLQAIQNALFLLKDEKGISEQGLQDLEIVLAESERMAALIERLRSTYRPTHDEDFQSTDINNVISEVQQLVATHFRNRNIEFQFKPDEQLPNIPALSAQVRQVVLNLVMNAADSMSTGGTLTIETKMLSDVDETLITVSDTGEGINPKILPNIFDAFITNKQSGTGIGLTISHDIVLKHKGRITAENNPDKGATFKVWLPARTREAI